MVPTIPHPRPNPLTRSADNANRQRDFSPHELNALRTALGVAAEVYDGDASTINRSAELAEAKGADTDGFRSLADQFRQQAREARALAERIDNR